MPHLVLEYSANVLDVVDPQAFFSGLHQALMEFESFPKSDIKSRAYRIPVGDFVVGEGSGSESFAHLRLRLLSGRDVSVRQRLAQACMRALEEAFTSSAADGHCQLSVELHEMDRSTYLKGPTPTESSDSLPPQP